MTSGIDRQPTGGARASGDVAAGLTGTIRRSKVRRARTLLALATSLGLALGMLGPALQADASSVTAASFSGGPGTTTVGGVVYAKQGELVTLKVTTSTDTRCVKVTGAHTASQALSARSSWSFTFTAGGGNGVATVTATAYSNGGCTNNAGAKTASYNLDNSPPVVTAGVSSTPNEKGWHKKDVGITWSATDDGVGLDAGLNLSQDSVTTSSSTPVTKTAVATDKLGNLGVGQVEVKLDKEPPAVADARLTPPNGNGWHNTDVTVRFDCDDKHSGLAHCAGEVTISEEGRGQSVTGVAVDNADNATEKAHGGIHIDKTPPTVSVPTDTTVEVSNASGAVIDYTTSARDALSGADAPSCSHASGSTFPIGTTVVTCAAKDKAGNEGNASFKITVHDNRCDKAWPTTGSDTSDGTTGTPGHLNPECASSPIGGGSGGTGGGAGPPIGRTPELGSLALFGAGAAGMVGYTLARMRTPRRRR